MKKLKVFEGELGSVRVVMHNREPWFIAADVCRALGIVNSRQAVQRVPSNERRVCSTYTTSGEREAWAVNEAGLYRLIFTSKKREAEEFKTWIFSEVLPAIRKIGVYSLPKVRSKSASDFFDEIQELRKGDPFTIADRALQLAIEAASKVAEVENDLAFARRLLTLSKDKGSEHA